MCATNLGIVLKKYITAAYSKRTNKYSVKCNALNNLTKSQPSISASQILLRPAGNTSK